MRTFLLAMAGAFLGCLLAQTPPARAGQQYLEIVGFDNRQRIQIGTYSAPGERGLPLVGLTDNNGHLRMLLRLAGPAESPVIVMKDAGGNDRLVMGLGLSNGDPFLSIVDARGQKRNIFGTY